MLSYGLLVISIAVVVIAYFILLINKFNSKKKLDNFCGFDAAKEVTSNYDSINVVSADIMVSEYDIKRNVIRLSKKNYDGDSVYDTFITSLLAGYSLVNSDNNSLFKFSIIINKIRCFSIVSLVMVVMSYFISNIGDAKLGLVIFILMLVYQYMRYQIAVIANDIIKNNLNKKVFGEIDKLLNTNVVFYKLSFIASLVMILRLVVIIMGM